MGGGKKKEGGVVRSRVAKGYSLKVLRSLSPKENRYISSIRGLALAANP